MAPAPGTPSLVATIRRRGRAPSVSRGSRPRRAPAGWGPEPRGAAGRHGRAPLVSADEQPVARSADGLDAVVADLPAQGGDVDVDQVAGRGPARACDRGARQRPAVQPQRSVGLRGRRPARAGQRRVRLAAGGHRDLQRPERPGDRRHRAPHQQHRYRDRGRRVRRQRQADRRRREGDFADENLSDGISVGAGGHRITGNAAYDNSGFGITADGDVASPRNIDGVTGGCGAEMVRYRAGAGPEGW